MLAIMMSTNEILVILAITAVVVFLVSRSDNS